MGLIKRIFCAFGVAACNRLPVGILDAGKNANARVLESLVNRIGGDWKAVSLALQMAEAADEETSNKRGYKLPHDFYISVASTVAAMNIDTPETPNIKHGACGTDPLSRSSSIIAALLEEGVAYRAISLDAIKGKFPNCDDLFDLTKENADVTALPISIKNSDNDGRMRIEDHEFNQEQGLHAHNLILWTENYQRNVLMRIAKSLYLARNLSKIKEDRKRWLLILNLQTLYLPLALELGLKDIQHEMQDCIAQAIGKEAYKKVDKYINELKETQKAEGLREDIDSVLIRGNFLGAQIKWRYKTAYSALEKIFKKSPMIEAKAQSKKQRELFVAEGADPERLRFVDYYYRDELIHATVWPPEQVDLEKVHDLVGFRIVLKDELKKDGSIDDEANRELCKRVNALLSGKYTPVKGREKWYEKPNGYKAYHNTFMSGNCEFEIHIVTKSMEIANGHSHNQHKVAVDADAHSSVQQQDAALIKTAEERIERVRAQSEKIEEKKVIVSAWGKLVTEDKKTTILDFLNKHKDAWESKVAINVDGKIILREELEKCFAFDSTFRKQGGSKQISPLLIQTHQTWKYLSTQTVRNGMCVKCASKCPPAPVQGRQARASMGASASPI